MKMIPAFAVCVCLTLSAIAQPQKSPAAKPAAAAAKAAAKPAPLDKAAIEKFVRYVYMYAANITVEVGDAKPSLVPGLLEVPVKASLGQASESRTLLVTPDGKSAMEATVYDTADPFIRVKEKLNAGLHPSTGTPGAPVVIVLFSDFQCSYCKQMAKTLGDNLLKQYPKEVRLYFKDYPLDAIHPWARNAAIAGRCLFNSSPQAFWPFHDWIFENQEKISVDNVKAKIMEWAVSKNLDTLQLSRCYDARETEKDVEASIADARALKVQSTPTLFVNGRVVPGSIPWPNLKMLIDVELQRWKDTGISGEKCCEVRLNPLPGAQK